MLLLFIAMPASAHTVVPLDPPGLLAPRRLLVVLGASGLQGLLLSPTYDATPTIQVMSRTMLVGLFALLAFGLFERWPVRLPPWLARWALQVLATAVAIPLGAWVVYTVITFGEGVPFWRDSSRLLGYAVITVTGMLFAPWIAMGALHRQLGFVARSQALAFELERSNLERSALDSRLRLLQAQVEPHFLFNTLANVRELVDTGSPQASKVLDNLIEYLRAAVPRLQQPASTLDEELQLVRAYLELMQMRMPDRLQFDVQADPGAARLRCPPTALLTLVENAVRHGIDPREEGGRIDVSAVVADGRCRLRVSDTGVGLRSSGGGLGTGLAALRERLALMYGDDAHLRIAERKPHGVQADLEFPAESVG